MNDNETGIWGVVEYVRSCNSLGYNKDDEETLQ